MFPVTLVKYSVAERARSEAAINSSKSIALTSGVAGKSGSVCASEHFSQTEA
jgi:hypothetical protein